MAHYQRITQQQGCLCDCLHLVYILHLLNGYHNLEYTDSELAALSLLMMLCGYFLIALSL